MIIIIRRIWLLKNELKNSFLQFFKNWTGHKSNCTTIDESEINVKNMLQNIICLQIIGQKSATGWFFERGFIWFRYVNMFCILVFFVCFLTGYCLCAAWSKGVCCSISFSLSFGELWEWFMIGDVFS